MSESPQIVAAAYFDDKVKSLVATRHGRKFSVGIISPGTYRFGTACAERMTVTSGSLKVQVEQATKLNSFAAKLDSRLMEA